MRNHPDSPRLFKRLCLPALACSVAFLLCELVSRPWAEVGISDDWSYIRSAQLLAQTGHVQYVGWASPIIGWQLYLGAAFIKLLGFSFFAARIPTLLIGLLTAYLMQRTLVRFGVGEGNAVLGTLTFVLSPLFMPLSASMMTDIPGFFSILACIYGCIRALQSPRDRDAVLWLCFAVAINAIGGSSRQVSWLGVLMLVPCTLWLLRSRRRVLLYGLAANALGYIAVFAILHWFNTQPYALPEPFSLAPLNVPTWKRVMLQYVRSFFEIGLLIFPLALPFVAAVRRLSLRQWAALLALALASIAFVYYLGQKPALRTLLYPFIGDWVGNRAVFEGTLLASPPPVVLSSAFIKSLSAIATVCILSIGAIVLVARPVIIHTRPAISLAWHQIAILFGPLTVVYFVLYSRHSLFWFFDRYLLLPIFIAMICVLLYSQQHLSVRWFPAGCVSVVAVALCGICTTHNLFALDRARLALANEVFATGLPPSHIDLGWEMNGWYELQIVHFVNEKHIVRPANSYIPITYPNLPGCHESEQPEFGLFLHLAPRYGVAFDPNLCEGPAPFAPVSYTTWPNFRSTTLYVVKYPPPWRPDSDYATQSTPAPNR